MDDQDATSGTVPTDCICGRGDWIYDGEVGMWCCGCGYVKRASGKGFKEGRLTLDDKRRIVEKAKT